MNPEFIIEPRPISPKKPATPEPEPMPQLPAQEPVLPLRKPVQPANPSAVAVRASECSAIASKGARENERANESDILFEAIRIAASKPKSPETDGALRVLCIRFSHANSLDF
jgi:hypothetical protein